MATIFNPLTNRSVKESGPIGLIIKSIKDWINNDIVQFNASRMLKQYRSKMNNNWKNDFLTIVRYYSPQHLEQSMLIINNVEQQEQNRIDNIYFDGSFFSEIISMFEIGHEQQDNKPTTDKQKKKLNKFLDSSIIEEKQCECSICLNFDESEEKIVQLKCKHKFHYNCISQWVSKVNSCPMCKNQCI